MLLHFGNKPFLRYDAQSFPSYAVLNAYDSEETAFQKTVTTLSLHDVPPNAHTIGTHVIFELQVADINILKARIAPHGNEEIIEGQIRSDCAICSLVGM